MLKIIGGRYRGLKIPSQKKANYRPSTGKLKEAIFSILLSGSFSQKNIFSKANILDLFAGTGSLGLECLSRGSTAATFNDIEKANLTLIQKFITSNDIQGQITYSSFDGLKLPNSQKQYDIVFIDPPYNLKIINSILLILAEKNWLKTKAILVIEYCAEETVIINDRFRLVNQKQYGNTNLSILRYE